MYTEPSVPFYMVLSVYIPLVLAAYLGIFLGLSALVALARALAGVLHGKGREHSAGAGAPGLGLEPGKA
jgi:hypothetical protein